MREGGREGGREGAGKDIVKTNAMFILIIAL